MATPSAQGQDGCERLAAPARAARALLVVESHRGHVPEHDSLEAADIDADLHGGRDAQHVNLVNGLDEGSLVGRVDFHDDVPEQPLPLGLVIGLRRELFGV